MKDPLNYYIKRDDMGIISFISWSIAPEEYLRSLFRILVESLNEQLS